MQPEEVSHAAPLASRHGHSVELAQILRSHGPAYLEAHPTSPEQRKVIQDVINCRTEILGGHLETCGNGCGYERLSFHSCRNRHCPKCQNLQKVRWLLERSEKLLPTPYFHVVVTLPHELNPLILQNREPLYNLLFETASEALIELAKGWHRLGAEPGFTTILHTWTQELQFHVHLHMVVTAGGLNLEGDRWIPAKNSFLVPVRALAKMVRGKFLDGLQKAFEQGTLAFCGNIASWRNPAVFKRCVRKLGRTKWVVYAKAPFGGPRHVFSYLGHYTHRVAISNQRLVASDDQTVTFRARDNQNPGTYRLVRVAAQEFIPRFLLHVLPHGFVRIRHFGLMASRNAHTKLQRAYRLLQPSQPTPPTPSTEMLRMSWQQLLLKLTGLDLLRCPNCGGNMVRKPLAGCLRLSPLTAASLQPLDTS
jgi:Putative transposase/Transposase zinc-binding domain